MLLLPTRRERAHGVCAEPLTSQLRIATHYGMIVILFSTFATPGADHAARSASFFSAHERTLPISLTVEPCVSTVMRRASTSALRRRASSILLLISVGET